MSISFYCDEHEIADFGNSTARAFLAVTEAVAKFYSSSFTFEFIEDRYITNNTTEFCSLVEQAFSDPSPFFLDWARYAAGMYESVKGERYIWKWGASFIDPIRYAGCAPPREKWSENVIGHYEKT